MRTSLLTWLLLITFTYCFGQSKQEVLDRYLLNIPLKDSIEESVVFLENSPQFGIDSVLAGGQVYSSYKTQLPFEEFHIDKIVIMLQKQYSMADTIRKTIFDTLHKVSVQYIFPESDEKGMDAFYKQARKSFRRVYAYDYERDLKEGDVEGRSCHFTNSQAPPFPELILYKGHVKGQMRYVTIRYDKRKSRGYFWKSIRPGRPKPYGTNE